MRLLNLLDVLNDAELFSLDSYIRKVIVGSYLTDECKGNRPNLFNYHHRLLFNAPAKKASKAALRQQILYTKGRSEILVIFTPNFL